MTENNDTSSIVHPHRVLSRKTAEPIIYLAHRMSKSDSESVRRETRIIDMVAKAVGYENYRHDSWFKDMTEAEALKRINSDLAKNACLVVLSLILKADSHRKDEEQEYFSWVRDQLGADPITVPIDIEEHKKLAMDYFTD